VLEAVHPLAPQLVRPGARLARRLVGAVEVHQEAARGRLAEQQGVQVDDLLGLVVEEVDLHPNHAGLLAFPEEHPPGAWGPQVLAVLPEPDADAVGPRVVDQLAELGVGPLLPEALDDVVLEPELASQSGKLLHAFERSLAAVEEPPDGPAGLD